MSARALAATSSILRPSSTLISGEAARTDSMSARRLLARLTMRSPISETARAVSCSTRSMRSASSPCARRRTSLSRAWALASSPMRASTARAISARWELRRPIWRARSASESRMRASTRASTPSRSPAPPPPPFAPFEASAVRRSARTWERVEAISSPSSARAASMWRTRAAFCVDSSSRPLASSMSTAPWRFATSRRMRPSAASRRWVTPSRRSRSLTRVSRPLVLGDASGFSGLGWAGRRSPDSDVRSDMIPPGPIGTSSLGSGPTRRDHREHE